MDISGYSAVIVRINQTKHDAMDATLNGRIQNR
jgi:hypothetical protein